VSQVQAIEPEAQPLGVPPPDAEITSVEGRTPWQLFWMRLKRDKVSLGAGFIVLVLVVLALTAPLFAHNVIHRTPGDINQNLTDDIGIPIVGPSKIAWFGVDGIGRDIFLRSLYGARISLMVSLLGTGISIVIGIVFGLLAGFRGGKVDTLISRVIDIVLSLPLLLIAISLAVACGSNINGCLGIIKPGVGMVVFIIVLFGWPYVARIVRGQTLSLREREFVEASRATGYGSWHIMMREILPNLMASIIVVATLLIPQNILFEAALSYLSVGIPPGTPSWGGMINDAVSGSLYFVSWWTLVFPAGFLVITTLAFNLLGDGLRDALDPRYGR
jgi:ABC-type dipeptide/oligopeptide/nickel transport system permease subunit